MPFIRSGCRLTGLLLLILIPFGCAQPEPPWSGISADGRVAAALARIADGIATVDYWRDVKPILELRSLPRLL
jgi:hypothetical protein